MKTSLQNIFYIITIIGTLFGRELKSQGTWEKINIGTYRHLNALYFADSLYGWVAGDSGIIIHTSDGGITWVEQPSGTTNDIVDLFFLDREQGWASSFNYQTIPFGTHILKTIDGGENWTIEPYPQNNIFINCILFLDSLHGWMGGRPHALVFTSDGGNTWQQAAIDTSILAFFPVIKIRFFDEKYGYACGGMFDIAGVIWYTHNGGDTWTAIDASFAPADEVHELHLFDSLTVMGAGGDPDFGYGVALMHTTDGGNSWVYEELGYQGSAQDLDFRTVNEVWCPLGHRRKLIFSVDAGITWTEVDTPDSTAIFDITFPDSLHGFAAGLDGALLRYHPPVITAGGAEKIWLASGKPCHEAFPNPFRSETNFIVTIPDDLPNGNALLFPLKIELIIRDLTGRPLTALTGVADSPGSYNFVLNGEMLQPGIYMTELKTGNVVTEAVLRIIKY